MSTIVCMSVHDMLYRLAAAHHDDWEGRAIALTGPDERVWAMSPIAQGSGVEIGLSPRQARSRCPDVRIHALDLAEAEAAQKAFLGVLTLTGLAVEPQGYGGAYCDLSAVSTSPEESRPVCADLGRQVRQELGAALAPSIGADCGKFTARAAAALAKPGAMRLVNREDEGRFLAAQPVALLPLPREAHQQLAHLGIRTLADFARLPVTSVVARFGKAGRTAHQWAQGRDDRPVLALATRAPEPTGVDFESPCANHDLALETMLRALSAQIGQLSESLRGCRKLQAELRFMDGSRLESLQTFAQPRGSRLEIQAGLAQALMAAPWPAELMNLRVTLLDIVEREPEPVSLFPDLFAPASTASPFVAVAGALLTKHPGALWQAAVTDPQHPIAERRGVWSPLAAS